MEHLEIFLREHPQYTLLKDAEVAEQEVLLWADGKRYIVLSRTPQGELCFTKDDLDKALMWKEKDNE